MRDNKHVVLIHGAWSRGEQLAPARAAFEERGYTAHTPTLRHDELPSREGAVRVEPEQIHYENLNSAVNGRTGAR